MFLLTGEKYINSESIFKRNPNLIFIYNDFNVLLALSFFAKEHELGFCGAHDGTWGPR